MALPDLRHFENRGIFYISSDPVEALAGEAWVPAIYTDKGWATADGANLLLGIKEWRHAVEAGQKPAGDFGKHPQGDQIRQVAKTGAGNRVRKSRQKPQT
jgi:hypothetical protein